MLDTTKFVFKVLDRGMIYILIAGTYTPFLMINMHGTSIGPILLAVQWILAIFGIYLSVREVYGPMTTLLYLIMGWLAMVNPSAFVDHFSGNSLYWIAAGGLWYTGGVYFFLQDEEKPMLRLCFFFS